MLKLVDSDERVGMSTDHTLGLHLFALTVGSGHEGVVSLVSVLKFRVKCLLVFDIRVPVTLSRSTVKVSGSESGITTFHSNVGTVKLGPCLLKEAHPEFAVIAASKAGTVVFAGDPVVNNNRGLNSVHIETEEVDTSVVDFLIDEAGHNLLGTLSHRAKAGEIVAVTESSLLDVVRVDTFSEDLGRLEDVRGTLPLDLAHARNVSVVVVHVDQAGHLGREVGIGPLFTGSNDLFDLSPFSFHTLVAERVCDLLFLNNLLLLEVALVFSF